MPKYKIVAQHPEYRVGTDGSVWSRWSKVANGGRGGGFTNYLGKTWKQMNPRVEKGSGYSGVTLCCSKTGKHRHIRVHKLVALAFYGECPAGMEVLHKNGDKSDNRKCNIRYGTKSENHADAVKHGKWTPLKGENNALHKMTDELVRMMRAEHVPGKRGRGAICLARKYGIGKTVAGLIVTGKRWKHVA